ncbi:hypothetical protein [Lysobacter sp. 1R34A]|uniref:hypothetical protein n=1 Tax=Lysobacter sp. 1R34A TaxID=3445786 RepID=UPI003EEC3F6F
MKRWLFDLARVALALCLEVLGLWAALAFMPLSDEFETFGLTSLLAVVAILAATGGLAGWMARRYFLAPALLLLWLSWAAFISLDQWSDVSNSAKGLTSTGSSGTRRWWRPPVSPWPPASCRATVAHGGHVRPRPPPAKHEPRRMQ